MFGVKGDKESRVATWGYSYGEYHSQYEDYNS